MSAIAVITLDHRVALVHYRSLLPTQNPKDEEGSQDGGSTEGTSSKLKDSYFSPRICVAFPLGGKTQGDDELTRTLHL